MKRRRISLAVDATAVVGLSYLAVRFAWSPDGVSFIAALVFGALAGGVAWAAARDYRYPRPVPPPRPGRTRWMARPRSAFDEALDRIAELGHEVRVYHDDEWRTR